MDSVHPLRRYLDETRQTLEDFAARSKVSASTLSKIINGHSFGRGRTLAAIVAATDGRVSAAQLIEHGAEPDAA